MAKRPLGPVHFPNGFLWGASSAAYQVEGGLTQNDWYEWGTTHPEMDPVGRATDFWNRYTEDFDWAHELGHNAFRMSVEWSRLEPARGQWDEAAFAHYREMLHSAHAHGLKTFVTLFHFTTPLWLSHDRGWLNPDAPAAFGEFAAKVAEELGTEIDFWLTLNEPNVRMLTGYVVGVGPPGEQNLDHALQMLANLLKGHANAYYAIHNRFLYAKVGFAHHMREIQADRWWDPLDVMVAGAVSDFWNRQILEAMQTGEINFQIPLVASYHEYVPNLAGTLDFIGVNYYTRDRIQFDPSAPTRFKIMPVDPAHSSELGMEIYPEGFYRMLTLAGSFGRPVYVTENGIADSTDSKRPAYICEHLRELGNAIADGVDVRGYLHWSLTDNWEWVYGYKPRLGLIAIDYSTLKRTPRKSSFLYRDIIRDESTEPCFQGGS